MRYWVLILLALLGACSSEAMFDTISTPQERAMALQAANALIAGDFPKFDDVMDVGLRDNMTSETMAKMKPFMPKGAPVLKKVFEFDYDDGPSTKTFTYEAGSGNRWAAIEITLRTAPGPIIVVAYRVWPLDHSPSSETDFSFAKAGAAGCFWIAMMILVLGITITGFVQVIRTRGLKLKWLWAIGCLFSFVTFWLQVGPGSFGVMPISFQLLGVGFTKTVFEPWVLKFSIPVLAIVFLILKARGFFDRASGDDAEAFM